MKYDHVLITLAAIDTLFVSCCATDLNGPDVLPCFTHRGAALTSPVRSLAVKIKLISPQVQPKLRGFRFQACVHRLCLVQKPELWEKGPVVFRGSQTNCLCSLNCAGFIAVTLTGNHGTNAKSSVAEHRWNGRFEEEGLPRRIRI